MKDATVLVVDDEKLIRWSMVQAIEEAGYTSLEAASASEALALLERETPDLLLLDHKLPDRDGTDILPEIHAGCPDLPVIMVTAHASIPGAIEAFRGGVCDYVGKPFEIGELMQSVQRALEASRLRALVAEQEEASLAGLSGGEIAHESPAMAAVVRTLQRVGQSGASTVLLLGESGVGKGVAARTIHRMSEASSGPMMTVSCTSLPEALLESELFGHEKGAFTDAKTRKKGLIELAEDGTMFLDEIGDMALGLQGKLLGFLEDRTFRRVGGVRDLRAQVRVIAATNKDLEEEVREGRFRKDLYYRLRVIPIRIPSLRQRREDIPALTRMFLARFNGEFGKHVTGLDEEAERAFARYPWPGNVRELRNTLERAVLLSNSQLLGLDDLPLELQGRELPPPVDSLEGHFELPQDGVDLELLERHLVVQALHRTDGNRARAARLLGMNRDQMRYRIKKFDLSEFQASDT